MGLAGGYQTEEGTLLPVVDPLLPGKRGDPTSHHETYVSAQRPASQAQARVPHPHADPWRTRRRQEPPTQGPAPAHCVGGCRGML